MQVTLSDMKANIGRYVELADEQDIVITKYGKPIAKIIRYEKEPWYTKKIPEKVTTIEQLSETLPRW
jgi:prevent-host-death family protein